MVKVFTDPNGFIVVHVRNLLEIEGVSAELRNEYAAGATGELAYVDVWPELWVEDWLQDRASALIKAMNSDKLAGVWCCCTCREENEPAFDFCWKCGEDRSDW
ncbi:putative signal transducing protein [Litoribrevibacter albus]|uniref:putative signal transducing protein n=1 Tax=Litoribrevibacter albus TaxID=1473156 RepID=UPI0024E09FA4|nr:DUF2007 domain-containing protein [Litoribrevibacter albus]